MAAVHLSTQPCRQCCCNSGSPSLQVTLWRVRISMKICQWSYVRRLFAMVSQDLVTTVSMLLCSRQDTNTQLLQHLESPDLQHCTVAVTFTVKAVLNTAPNCMHSRSTLASNTLRTGLHNTTVPAAEMHMPMPQEPAHAHSGGPQTRHARTCLPHAFALQHPSWLLLLHPAAEHMHLQTQQLSARTAGLSCR